MRTEKEELEYKIEKTERKLERLKRQLKEFVLPKRWEDFECIKGYFVSLTSDVSYWNKEEYEELEDSDKNVFATREQAEASIALAQLSQLREVYRQGWKPDWNSIEQEKFIIIYTHRGIFECSVAVNIPNFLSFQSPEIRDEFLENFRDLIKKANPLMS